MAGERPNHLRCGGSVIDETGEHACGALALVCVDCGRPAGCDKHALRCQNCGKPVCGYHEHLCARATHAA
jgi:hypothetical protein